MKNDIQIVKINTNHAVQTAQEAMEIAEAGGASAISNTQIDAICK